MVVEFAPAPDGVSVNAENTHTTDEFYFHILMLLRTSERERA